MNLFIVFDIHEKLRNGHAEFRMYDLGRDLTERDKYELSIRHLRVRNPQVFFLYDKGII